MKGRIVTILILIGVSVHAQNTAIDKFFSDNPLDIFASFDAYNYTVTEPELEEGTHLAGGAGVGWRYTIISGDDFSVFPHIALGGGYMEQESYKSIYFQAPLTLDIALGAGASPRSKANVGFTLGAGYAANYFNYTRVYDDTEVGNSDVIMAPTVNFSVNFRYDGFAMGVKPSVSIAEDYWFAGVKLIAYIMYE